MDIAAWLESLTSIDTWVPPLGYLFGIVGAHYLIGPTLSVMWELLQLEAKVRKLSPTAARGLGRDPFIRYLWQIASVGFIERTLYMASLQAQRPEFIAVWLTLKTLVRARGWKEEDVNPGRAVYNNFLLGNGLSILYSFVAVGAIQWATASPEGRDYMSAVSVPVALILFNIGLIVWLKRHRRKLLSELKATD